MKIIISLLASAVLTTLAIAQEESPSPAESTAPAGEEKPSATVEETPAASITPAPEKKAEAVSSPTPAATMTVKKPATAAAPATSAKPAAAAAPAAKMGKNMSVKDMENAWEAAVGKHDVATLQPMIANDFVGVYWDGKVMSKSGIIGMYKKDKDTYTSAVNQKLDARSVGPNVTVVVGTAREKGTGKDGKAFDRSYRFTDTWVMRNGQWQCVASQVMKVKG
jgi:ketosteroid isomerase-like protein